MVGPDEEMHREAERQYWLTDDVEDIAEFWDDAPTHEKWRKGGRWN